ncbi:MAG TPA: pitrilysin family protein [Ilumatobacter sp.]|nr:pitrilysin family protein [Ilumatobacter sp.]
MSERIVTLPSGLIVAVEPMSNTRTAAIGVYVGVGGRHDPAGHAGTSHFLEHVLFKGTARRGAIEISQAVDRLGGDINAYTSKEYTAFYCRVPARHAATGIGLIGELVTEPALRPADIEGERQVILEELAMDDDTPDDVAHQAFSAALFPHHPLGCDTAGDRQTVNAITAESLTEFFQSTYHTGNAVVAVAGAVDPDQVVEQVTEAFAPMPQGAGRLSSTVPTTQPAWGTVVLDDDTEQTHIVTGGRALPRDDADREALDVVNHVFGGGLSSRLFDEIRERRGLAYSVASSAVAFGDAGAWSVYAGTMPQHADAVCDLIDVELHRLVSFGITAEELEIARGYLTGSFEMGLEDSGARMARLGGQLLLRGEVRACDDQLARWDAVTLDDTRKVIERVYAGETITIRLGPAA